MTTITGTITSPAANLTHTEPANSSVGALESGEKNLTIGTYKNTGNVNQTVTFTGISNVVNCEFVNKSWATMSGASSAAAVVLAPGQQAVLSVNVYLANQPIGSAPVNFSFDVNVIWS